MKKRMVNSLPGGEAGGQLMEFSGLGAASTGMMSPDAMATLPSDQFPGLAQMVMADDLKMQFTATQQYRKLLSIEHNPPIQEVIASGVVPRFVHYLRQIDRPDLQFEAAWVLTNIASGTAE